VVIASELAMTFDSSPQGPLLWEQRAGQAYEGATVDSPEAITITATSATPNASRTSSKFRSQG
jgi:hypothetical protein